LYLFTHPLLISHSMPSERSYHNMAIGRIPEPGTGIPESIVDAKGDIVTATAADTPARLAVGTNEHRLVADSGEATGLKYVADTTNFAIAAKGDLLVGTAADTLDKLSVGTNGHTLVADSSTSTGLKWAAPAGGGKVLQVVYGSTSTDTTSTTATYVDTNLSASITPSSVSSQVLVLFSHQECAKSGDTRMRMKLLRGATDILQIAQNMGNSNSSMYYQWASMSACYLDSPSTTSSTTYKTQFNNENATGTTYVNGSGTCVSTMILMEIGA